MAKGAPPEENCHWVSDICGKNGFHPSRADPAYGVRIIFSNKEIGAVHTAGIRNRYVLRIGQVAVKHYSPKTRFHDRNLGKGRNSKKGADKHTKNEF